MIYVDTLVIIPSRQIWIEIDKRHLQSWEYTKRILSPLKISNLAEYIAKVKRVSLYESLVYIYSNPLYKELYNEGARWWYLSSEALYEEFEIRRKERKLQVIKIII